MATQPNEKSVKNVTTTTPTKVTIITTPTEFIRAGERLMAQKVQSSESQPKPQK